MARCEICGKKIETGRFCGPDGCESDVKYMRCRNCGCLLAPEDFKDGLTERNMCNHSKSPGGRHVPIPAAEFQGGPVTKPSFEVPIETVPVEAAKKKVVKK